MTFRVIAKACNHQTTFSLVRICKKLKVSRSGFYKSQIRKRTPDKDQDSYKLIKQIFEEKKEKVGIRQIKMLIKAKHDLVMNKKKIARIKNKYQLLTKKRIIIKSLQKKLLNMHLVPTS